MSFPEIFWGLGLNFTQKTYMFTSKNRSYSKHLEKIQKLAEKSNVHDQILMLV